MSSDQKKQDPLGALRRKLSVQKVNVAKVKALSNLVKLKTIAKISIMGRIPFRRSQRLAELYDGRLILSSTGKE